MAPGLKRETGLRRGGSIRIPEGQMAGGGGRAGCEIKCWLWFTRCGGALVRWCDRGFSEGGVVF